jgi:hypothetical protein
MARRQVAVGGGPIMGFGSFRGEPAQLADARGNQNAPHLTTPQKRKEKTLHALLAQVEGLASRADPIVYSLIRDAQSACVLKGGRRSWALRAGVAGARQHPGNPGSQRGIDAQERSVGVVVNKKLGSLSGQKFP